jgi:hypothetical protein
MTSIRIGKIYMTRFEIAEPVPNEVRNHPAPSSLATLGTGGASQ